MKRLLVCAALTVALVLPTTALAHPGGVWFDTAAHTSTNIENKYPRVAAARCFKIPTFALSMYPAHSTRHGESILWDHFACALAIANGPVCFVIAHITGQQWNQFYLTSYYYHGCTPYVLH